MSANLGRCPSHNLQLLQKSPLPSKDGPLPTVEQMRQHMATGENQRYHAGPTFGTSESVMSIPMRDGHQSEIRVFKPATHPSSGSPLVVLLFGGGFVTGSNLQLAPVARSAAALYGATAVALSYRRAPEHKFPTAPNDTWDSVKWLAANAPSLGADLSVGFVLGGVSAGGGMTITTAQRAIKEKLSPPLTGLWACIPVALEDQLVPAEYKHMWHSREQNTKVPLLDGQSIELVRKLYQPDITSEDYSPFNSGIGFSGLPRTYVQVCGMDPLRDDGLIYERALRDQGVETKLDVYPGQPHAFFSAFPDLKQSQKYRADTTMAMGWLLRRQPDSQVLQQISATPSASPADPSPTVDA